MNQKPDHAIPQNQKLLGYLRLNGSITPAEALHHYGIYRLGARIYELKLKGHTILTQLEKTSNGKHFAKYTLVDLK